MKSRKQDNIDAGLWFWIGLFALVAYLGLNALLQNDGPRGPFYLVARKGEWFIYDYPVTGEVIGVTQYEGERYEITGSIDLAWYIIDYKGQTGYASSNGFWISCNDPDPNDARSCSDSIRATLPHYDWEDFR